MEVNSAHNSALAGIQSGMQGLDSNADAIAKASKGDGEPKDIVNELVDSQQNKLQVEANVKMMKTVDDTVGSLLDEMV